MLMTLNDRKFYVSQSNPYGNEWTAVCENYDAEWDSETGWHSSYPVGEGDTPEDAIKDLLLREEEQ